MPKPNRATPTEEPKKPDMADEYDNLESLQDTDLDVPKTKEKSKDKPLAAAAKEVPVKKVEEDDDELETKEPVHSPRLLKMCEHLDIDQELIDSLDSEQLQAVCNREIRKLKRQEKENSHEERGTEAIRDKQKARDKDESQNDKDKEEEVAWGEGVDEDGKPIKFTDKDIHPALLPILKQLVKDNKELKSKALGREQTEQEKAVSNFERDFDKSCSRFEKTLGVGTIKTLKDTPFAKKRVAVVREVMQALQENPKLSIDKAVEDAVASIFGIKLAAAAKAEEEEEKPKPKKKAVGYGDEATVVRPTGRNSDLKKGKAKAEDAVERWMNENMDDDDEKEKDDDDELEY